MSQPLRPPSAPLPADAADPGPKTAEQADLTRTDTAPGEAGAARPGVADAPLEPPAPASTTPGAQVPPERRRPRAPAWLPDLAGAWVFYSVLPGLPGVPPRFERIARFAPWIGALLGGLQGLLWWLMEGRLPPLAQVCLVLAAGLALSGGLHMDGAMDTADGLAAGERRLEAMADSRVGASGVQAMVMVLLLRAGALATLGPLAPAGLVWAALWGRVSPLIAMARFPYLRERGSAAFHRRHWAGLAAELRPTLLLLAALLLLSSWLPGALRLTFALGTLGGLPALAVPLWLGRRLGGHSGDSYGACVEWCESLALLVMALALVVAGDHPGVAAG